LTFIVLLIFTKNKKYRFFFDPISCEFKRGRGL